ncbi:hypothetical protein Glove_482g56 [Diversispora epigaea]|uniref:Uncharacterized protein n=1 Tax=Diversispora epigaea TaxID=1348612 RepID=A0A397GJL1_9GLOM|nr:hypothetical protein Glove_482g56 [Diversispora epigaea]
MSLLHCSYKVILLSCDLSNITLHFHILPLTRKNVQTFESDEEDDSDEIFSKVNTVHQTKIINGIVLNLDSDSNENRDISIGIKINDGLKIALAIGYNEGRGRNDNDGLSRLAILYAKLDFE